MAHGMRTSSPASRGRVNPANVRVAVLDIGMIPVRRLVRATPATAENAAAGPACVCRTWVLIGGVVVMAGGAMAGDRDGQAWSPVTGPAA